MSFFWNPHRRRGEAAPAALRRSRRRLDLGFLDRAPADRAGRKACRAAPDRLAPTSETQIKNDAGSAASRWRSFAATPMRRSRKNDIRNG